MLLFSYLRVKSWRIRMALDKPQLTSDPAENDCSHVEFGIHAAHDLSNSRFDCLAYEGRRLWWFRCPYMVLVSVNPSRWFLGTREITVNFG